MRRIMVATDGSSGADRAVDIAAELAKAVAGDLLIVTIAGTLSEEEARQFERAKANIGDALEAVTGRILHAAEARARRLGISNIQVHTGWGEVVESLIEIASNRSIDMIVLGRRGRGQLAGPLLGSVSQKVVSLAPCVVVVVP
jgi:nucleotide-binding universal stress UspA family protein